MPKFEDVFAEPVWFTHGAYLVSGEYSREKAAELFSHYLGEDIDPKALSEDRVRFGFAPDYVEDRDSLPAQCWYSGCKPGKGSKPVWVYG